MGDALIDRPIEELYRLYAGNLPMMMQLISPNAVIARFQRRPEEYMYFFHNNGDRYMTPVDVDRPVRGLRHITLGRLPGLDDIVSGSSGLLVQVFRNLRVLCVFNPLVCRQVDGKVVPDDPFTRIISFPSQLSVGSPIGPVQIFVNQDSGSYVIWFYVYISPHADRMVANTGMYIMHSQTEVWNYWPYSGIPYPYSGVEDDLVIDRDVSAYLFEPVGGLRYFKYDASDYNFGSVKQSDLPVGYERGEGCFTSFGHFAVISGFTWAFQTETVRRVDTGRLHQLCFISFLCKDSPEQLLGSMLNRWSILHTLVDEQLLGLVFDQADGSRQVRDRIIVTADRQYFYVCARNDARVFRVNPSTGLVEVVVANGVVSNTRDRVFVMPASFILP